jgi:hypothetical protein
MADKQRAVMETKLFLGTLEHLREDVEAWLGSRIDKKINLLSMSLEKTGEDAVDTFFLLTLQVNNEWNFQVKSSIMFFEHAVPEAEHEINEVLKAVERNKGHVYNMDSACDARRGVIITAIQVEVGYCQANEEFTNALRAILKPDEDK